MTCRAAVAALSLVAGAALCPCSAAQEGVAPVRQVVLDIISFSRWPEPRAALQLCVVGQAIHAGGFFEAELRSGATPVRAQRVGAADPRLAGSCDVVYLGGLTAPEREAAGRLIAGYPVLTLAEPGPGCVQATMFCLQVSGAQVSFSTNLDAVSRSGIRLSPRVLLLGRRPEGAR